MGFLVALLAEGVGRNLPALRIGGGRPKSPSSRRAWVEIGTGPLNTAHHRSPSSRRAWVEIVIVQRGGEVCFVALLAEGVGRNVKAGGQCIHLQASPSSRRAWVEIGMLATKVGMAWSPSSRRAWVEIAR